MKLRFEKSSEWAPERSWTVMAAGLLGIAAVGLATFLWRWSPAHLRPAQPGGSVAAPAAPVRTSPRAVSWHPRHLRWPYNEATTVQFQEADVHDAWEHWRRSFVTAEGAGDRRLRVLGGVDDGTTVSEGQAYGMLFTALFDEPEELAALWRFAKDHLDSHGLMHWHIGRPGEILGANAATDADVDMALALVYACGKIQTGAWAPPQSEEHDYCADARQLIDRIHEWEVNHTGSPTGEAGDELVPGDWRDPDRFPRGLFNPSYFSPGHFRVFGRFSGRIAEWEAVIRRGYRLSEMAQRSPGNCSHLVPNWTNFEGAPQQVPWQPEDATLFAWDAPRFAFRVALDWTWFGSRPAARGLNLLAGFFSSVGMDELRTVYRLDGTWVHDVRDAFFLANAGVAIWAAPDPVPTSCGQARGVLEDDPQTAYDTVLVAREAIADRTGYYQLSWRLFAMLLMTGNFPTPIDE